MTESTNADTMVAVVTGSLTRATRIAGSIVIACIAVAISARVSVTLPGSPVPQSLQTLAVILVGAWLGTWSGAAALLLYLVAGGLGAPVFADGAAGWLHLVGPTAGYLAGFVLASALAGRAREIGLLRRITPAIAVMVMSHVLILGLGWAWLGFTVGAGAAWETGVRPFIAGGVVKSLVGALVVVAAQRSRRSPDSDPPLTSSGSSAAS